MARPDPGWKASRGGPGGSLRPDTVVGEVGDGERSVGVYVGGMPGCCLASFKGEVRSGGIGLDEVVCDCGRRWRVLSSLDERVTEKFRVGSENRRAG